MYSIFNFFFWGKTRAAEPKSTKETVRLLPRISNFFALRQELAYIQATRGHDFALGTEIGFGSPDPQHELQTLVKHGLNNYTNRSIAINLGIAYGSLLADLAELGFRIDAQRAFATTKLSLR